MTAIYIICSLAMICAIVLIIDDYMSNCQCKLNEVDSIRNEKGKKYAIKYKCKKCGKIYHEFDFN